MKGNVAEEGTEKVAANGYTYVKQGGKWRPKAHPIMEKKLGRALNPGESVGFIDGDNTNFDPENLYLRAGTSGSARKKISRIQTRVSALVAEMSFLLDDLPEADRTECEEFLASLKL